LSRRITAEIADPALYRPKAAAILILGITATESLL